MLRINCQAAVAQQGRFANCSCARLAKVLREVGRLAAAQGSVAPLRRGIAPLRRGVAPLRWGVAPLRPYDMVGRGFRCFAFRLT